MFFCLSLSKSYTQSYSTALSFKKSSCVLLSVVSTTTILHILTSAQSEQVANAEHFGLVQVALHGLLGLIVAGDVEHRLHQAVVQHDAGDLHAARRLVASRIAGRMPRDVAEQRLAARQTLESVLTYIDEGNKN